MAEDNSLCPVCGYSAEGNHYGILSCRSCASFFKRVVEKGDTFDRHPMPVPGVPFNYCNIKENRNSCKQCRYLKCLETGMQTSAVQPRREPTGSQANRKRKTIINQADPAVLSDDIQSPSVSSASVESDFYRSASASPTQAKATTNLRVFEQQQSFTENLRSQSQSSKRDKRAPSTESNSRLKVPSGTKEENGEPSSSRRVRESKEEKVTFSRLLSCESERKESGDGDSSNDSSRLNLLGNSTRSFSERFIEPLEDNDEEEEMLPWLNRRVECPVCPKQYCREGLSHFLSLVQSFSDHTRQMQLSFSSIEEYIQETAKGAVLREMEPGDINKLSNVELAGLLFWVEKMGHFNAMSEEDQMNLLKRYSVRKLSLDHFYSASKYREQAKIRSFVLNNYTYVPADKTGFETPSEDLRQREAKFEIFKHTFERFWINVIDKFITLDVGDVEIVFLHYMLMWSPLNNQFVNNDSKNLLQSRRNWALQMIFEFYHNRQVTDAELRVGELINLYQEIENVVEQHCSDVHVAKLFDFCDLSDYWYDHTCYSAINTDRPIDSALDVSRLLAMFADLGRAHMGSATEETPPPARENPPDIIPDIEQIPRRIDYNMKGQNEPMKIIKWMSSQTSKERLLAFQKTLSMTEQRNRPLHVPSRLDFVIPSTKNGKPIYPLSVLQNSEGLLPKVKQYGEIKQEECTDHSMTPSPRGQVSSSVSPEGMKADSPDSYAVLADSVRSN